MTCSMIDYKQQLDKIIQRSAAKNFVDIDELVMAVKYISENESATGSVLNVDNGYF